MPMLDFCSQASIKSTAWRQLNLAKVSVGMQMFVAGQATLPSPIPSILWFPLWDHTPQPREGVLPYVYMPYQYVPLDGFPFVLLSKSVMGFHFDLLV